MQQFVESRSPNRRESWHLRRRRIALQNAWDVCRRNAQAEKHPTRRARAESDERAPRFDRPKAVHVTLRVADHVWNLRSQRAFLLIEQCLADALGRFGLRIIQFTVMGNHIHLIVEADSSEALSRGMQGLCIRIAKALN